MFKKDTSKLIFLQKQQLPQANEQALVAQAITKLQHKENEYQVLGYLRMNLADLARKRKLSKEGVALLTQLSKPNLNVDVARASGTWF